MELMLERQFFREPGVQPVSMITIIRVSTVIIISTVVSGITIGLSVPRSKRAGSSQKMDKWRIRTTRVGIFAPVTAVIISAIIVSAVIIPTIVVPPTIISPIAIIPVTWSEMSSSTQTKDTYEWAAAVLVSTISLPSVTTIAVISTENRSHSQRSVTTAASKDSAV